MAVPNPFLNKINNLGDPMADLANKQSHLILVNALVEKDGNLLISQRSFDESHEPGKWTIPGGKVDQTKGNVWNIIEETLAKEVLEETGVKIKNEATLICNNTFIRSTGHHVVALIFLCHWKSGKARPLEDTIDIKWIAPKEVDKLKYPPNVRTYLIKGFKAIKKL